MPSKVVIILALDTILKIKHGMPIQEVAIILGHEKLDTTMKYVDIDQTDVKNSYRKYV